MEIIVTGLLPEALRVYISTGKILGICKFKIIKDLHYGRNAASWVQVNYGECWHILPASYNDRICYKNPHFCVCL